MSKNPLVSIIIPTYNRAHLIKETLDSVLTQTYTNWECIIVDDGNSDNTEEVINSYIAKDQRFKYCHRPSEHLPGGNGARNFGFKKSKGDLIQWFDDDDVMHKNKLSIQVKSLLNTKYYFSVCQTIVFDNDINNIIGLKCEKIYSDNTFNDYIRQKIVWMTPSAIWKRNFLNTLDKLFDEELKAAQEWEFHSRILYKNRDYHHTDQPLVYIRKHDQSVSYNGNEERRKYHYFLARLKLNHFLKKQFDKDVYINDYLINYYKYLIKSKQLKKGIILFFQKRLYLINSKFLVNTKLVLAAFSFKFFNKGECFIRKR